MVVGAVIGVILAEHRFADIESFNALELALAVGDVFALVVKVKIFRQLRLKFLLRRHDRNEIHGSFARFLGK